MLNDRILRHCWSLIVLAFVVAGCSSPAPRLSRSIPLPGVGGAGGSAAIPGRFDHFGYDKENQRLFVAAVANGSLEVVDLKKGERIKSITGLDKPQGVAIVPATGQAIVACGGEGAIHAFDTRTLEEKNVAKVGEDVDNVRFLNGRIYVGYGSETNGAIAALDPATLSKLSELPLPAHPESFQITPDGMRVFANIPWAKRADVDGSVVAGELKNWTVSRTWPLAGTARNFPMAIDAENHRAFIASRKPSKLICLDTDTGNILSQVPCAEDSDDLFLDAKTGRVIVIGGGDRESAKSNGAIELYSIGKNGELKRIASTRTAPRARTGYFSPDLRSVFVAVPRRPGHEAELLEYSLPE